jgi:transposase-like protein
MDDLSRFCCQDPDCPDYAKRGHGNLTVTGRYGKAQQHRLLYCLTCKARFSERKGTPLFNSCLPEDKAIDLIKHLADRNGVRATARLVGVHRDTVVRYGRLLGEHAQQLHDELVAFSPSDRRSPARREVVVRLQEAGALRP